MIRCFPDPHPDELLYSICARFSDRMGYPTEYAVVQELFGTHAVKAVVDLPSHLGRLISMLPPGTSYTVDDLIDDHTLLPFYRSFLPPERLQCLRNDMCGDNGPGIHMRVGIVGCPIPLPVWLRFCPLCMAEDIKHFGECYWHRIHQVPGVEVCPVHEVFLQNSSVHARNTRPQGQFISANRVIQAAEVRQVDPSNRCHIMLLEIARDAIWLLDQHGSSAEFESLHKRYIAALVDRGFTTYRGKVYTRRLLEAFKIHYPSDLLKPLHCELDENRKSTWLARMIHTSQFAKHPLYHLLLIHFLGYTVKDFFNQPLPVEQKPFGEGPWPCLNPTSNHYRRLLIQECHISFHPKTKVRPLGTFSCTCGFVYCRFGPDQTPDDRFRIGKVKSFGLIWEATLRQLWEDHSLSLRQVAHRLGVGTYTVKVNAFQLGLSFNRGTGKSLTKIIPRSPKASEISKVDKLETYRQKWLSSMEEEPDAGIAELRSKLSKIYFWLYDHDKDWLKSHLPKHKRSIMHPSHVDWASRDAQYVEAVKASVVRLTSTPLRPIRLTISEISRDIGLLPSMEDCLDKLPLTALLLDEVVETHEMFAVRRIQWAAELYKQENISPTRWQLMKRSGVIEAHKKWPLVQSAIDAALESLIR